MTEITGQLNPALSAQDKLDLCQDRIGYRFNQIELLQSALTHASGAAKRVESNERLEFLGDSILGLVVCEHLFREYPSYLEGELTKIKSIVVSRRVCAKASRNIGLEECLIVGRGMQGTSVPRSLLSDVFESIVAAVYLDGNLDAVRSFILRSLDTEIHAAANGYTGGNYKSQLQHMAQRELGVSPTYVMVSHQGPDHNKTFEMAALLNNKRYSSAWGRNKKDAEQRAAANCLAEIRGEVPPFTIET